MPKGIECKTWQEHIDRFWSWVNLPFDATINECWEWTGCLTFTGYGYFSIKGKMLRAHRFVYTLYVGEVSKHLKVCHRCNNKLCVNPNHLYLGTQKQNMIDAMNDSLYMRDKISGRFVTTVIV